MFRKYFYCYTFLSILTVNPSVVSAHELGAHVHGLATLQVAVDEKFMTLSFSSPLDNLLGFEHVARNAKQKAAVKAMAEKLNKAQHFFIPTAEAQCTLHSVKLDSLLLEAKPSPDKQGGHADLDGEFVFTCKQIDKLHDLDVLLFDAFPHIRQIKVEVATLKKQTAATLVSTQRRASW